jgi:hypothetical protein
MYHETIDARMALCHYGPLESLAEEEAVRTSRATAGFAERPEGREWALVSASIR